MSAEHTPPPVVAARLLRALLPDALGDEALDELADHHAYRVARDGRAAANRWYWRQLPGFLLRLRVASFPGGPLAPVRVLPHSTERRETMGSIGTDLRYALRGLLRKPGFTLIAVVTLALGIGANTAIFSVVRTVLLRPLPFPEPERLVALFETRSDRGFTRASFTYANFYDVRDMNRSLDAMGAIAWTSATLSGGDQPERLDLARVTTGFLRALRVTPASGRVFAPGEDEPSADSRVVVLSHRWWTSHMGARPAVGATLTLDGAAHRVIGVLPPGTPWLDAADVFVPLVRRPNANRGSFELTVIARLAAGVTMAQAQSDLRGVAARIADQYPEAKAMGVAIVPSAEWVASDSLRRALWVLMGAVGALLLIACVNIVNLLLARASARVRERAVRSALGATRGRAVQLALAEASALGVLGGAAGIGLAWAIIRLLRRFDPRDIPRLADVHVDGATLAFAVGVTLLASIATGVVPALRGPRADMSSVLRDGERSVMGSRRGGRLRRVLVGAEVALSLMLLVGAGLLLRSFSRILGVDRGFETDRRTVFSITMPPARDSASEARAARLLVDLQQRFSTIPLVKSAAAVSMRPLRGTGTGMGFTAADKPKPPSNAIPWASWRLVTRDYFRSMGVRLVAGRDFTEQDLLGKPWRTIISQRIAEQLWPGESAVGRQMMLWSGQNEIAAEVVGVASNMRDWSLTEDPTLAVYLPYYGASSPSVNFVVHATTSESIIPAVRAVLAELSPGSPVSNVTDLGAMVDRSVASRRFTMMLMASLAVVALVLALAGVYGVLSYSVSQRRSEMGMRLALGASRRSVLNLVMRQGMMPVVVGLVVGVGGAVALSRFMTTLLFGITPGDFLTYVSVAALLGGAAALACYLPAREALRVDVLAALREE